VNPIVHDTSYILPAEIWHWCESNSPQWAKIHRGTCDPYNLQAAVGYNALYACRPSMGEDYRGGLYVTWEQFDSSNVEPATNLLRGDIFYSRDNYDNGASWVAGVRISDRTTGSHRFPSCVDYLSSDTLWVVYEIDRTAGMFVMGVGPVTTNPVIVHKVPVIVGIAENGREPVVAAELTARPNPFSARVGLNYAVPRAGNVNLTVYDLSGRPVARLVDGQKDVGRFTASWQPLGLAPGVYLARLVCGTDVQTAKLTLTR
jgi:hypothetical protein